MRLVIGITPVQPTILTQEVCRQDGVKAALEAFKHTRKVHAFWRNRQVVRWAPEPLWQQACDSLREIGLFPDAALEARDD